MVDARDSRTSAAPLTEAAEMVAAVESRARRLRSAWAGGEMTWRAWGSGPPLVLLHGDFGSWTHWVRNVPPLSNHFRVIAPDMPGYGDSDTPSRDWTPASLAAILAEGLDEIVPRGNGYALAGFSFGGIIAGHLSAADPVRVEKLILIGAGGFAIPQPPLPPLRRVEAGMEEADVIAAHRHNLAALMIADPARADDLAVHLQIENVRRARIRAGGIPVSDSLLRALDGARAPICGLWGERDAMSGASIRDRESILRRYRPDLDFRVVPEAGHWAPFESPDWVNTALLEMAGR